MKKTFIAICFVLILFSLAACGADAPSSSNEAQLTCPTVVVVISEETEPDATLPSPVATPDPCLAENLPGAVDEVHRLMREFDDASSLAGSVPREQLADQIANMQRIRREAEDQSIAFCLADLKAYQLSHMNVVINTLIAFLGGSDQATVDQGIELARQYHDDYTLELAELLNITIQQLELPETTPTP